MLPPVERFDSDSGARIYRISCQAFPELVAHVYLVLEAGPPTLIDTGSGYGESNVQILAGIEAVGRDFGEPVALGDIQRIIITHGHIDHFGGLAFFVERTQAQVGIHQLDLRIVTAYEERLLIATRALREYLGRAGVRAGLQPAFMEMYGFSKKHVRSLPVDLVITDGDQIDAMRFIHTPGHCPGQVCIAIGDVLISADHILPVITPHQSPESITRYTGLGHYFESLAKVKSLGGFELALGGHEGPIRNIEQRIDEIRASHLRKLDRILAIIRAADEPTTINDISQQLYNRVKGFHLLLALEEVGAHVEYLYERGEIGVANLDEIEREENPPVKYHAVT